ncbi:MAG: hypothetical protein ACPHSF_05035 [Flavobacteriales bacterium]
MMTFPKSISALAFVAVALFACNKSEERAVEATDEVRSESMLDAVDRAVEAPVDALTMRAGGGADCGEGGAPWPDCVEITDSGEDVYPRTITIDFGDDCFTPNGLQRTGTIEVVLTGDVRNEEGAVRTVTFEDLTIGDVMTVNGTRTMTNTGQNEEGQWTFAQETSTTIDRPVLDIVRTYAGTRTWLAGHDTEECGDDIWQRDGAGEKTISNGMNEGVVTVTYDAVVYDRPCGYPVSGTVTLVRNQLERIMDFGDGTCDALAELTINGTTYLFDLETHEIIE